MALNPNRCKYATIVNSLTMLNASKFYCFYYVPKKVLFSIYSFSCLRYGTLCIRENPGCLFIATNRDAVTHLTDAQEWAGFYLSLIT